ncbi:C39 family peptidase [Fundicoccus culcitae]|uniref:C39 family peptidase n=1 Tax=Fundicoccus culcitae TaxID=2969821 RepID=A0ABY5P2V2_9LACT|nr:C39 family peptidase [Fundicoccus culcitae]UUX33053.1 C39 family peptidase [Fundicoccus culcitae]
MPSNKVNLIASSISIILIVVGVYLIVRLGDLTAQNSVINADTAHFASESDLSEQANLEDFSSSSNEKSIEESETVVLEEELNFNTVLANPPEDQEASKQLINDIIAEDYNDNILLAQDDIVAAINEQNLDTEEMGALFLPENPAQSPNLQAIPQLDVPLLTQKDPEWRDVKYGNDANELMGETGCAILSLAMVHEYLSGSPVSPIDILDWSKENYYVDNHGTSWNIFGDFANQFGYGFINHGDNFYSAINAVQNGEVVVASVLPGYFTDVGHILVIRGYQNGMVYVNDPNDDPDKMYSVQGIDESVFLNEGVNYWSYTN